VTSAQSRLARSLAVGPGEERLFAWGASTLFLIGWAAVSLANVSETFFLKRIGVDRLPVVFLVNSLLLVGTTYTMSRVAARVAPRRLLVLTFGCLASMVAVLWLLLLARAPGIFVLLVIASKQLDAIALIAFWIVLGGLVHGRQAKRLYAPMIAGGTLGRIFGSFASGSLGAALGIPTLLPAAAIVLAIASLLAARVRAAAPAHVTRMAPSRGAAPEPALAKFGTLWRESRLFRLLVLGAFFAGTLGPMLYFQFAYIANLATRGTNGEMRLLDLYAKLRGFINLGVLAMQLVGTSRVFRRLGLPLSATLSPLIYLLGFFGVSTRLDLPSGIGAVGGANLQDHAIQEPAQRILITLLPERIRPAATSLIDGPVQRFGGAVGNVLVLCVIAVSAPAMVGFTALPIAALWLATAIALWRVYPALLLEATAAAPMHAAMTESLPELVDPSTVRVLMSALVDPEPRRCRAGCALVVEGPRAQAVATLARAVRDAPAANRPLLIDTLHELLERPSDAGESFPAAAQDLEPLLHDNTALPPGERAHLVEAYARLVPSLRPGSHAASVLAALLDDPAEAVRLAAMVRLDRSGLRALLTTDADAAVSTALTGDDQAARHVAFQALRMALLATNGGAALPHASDGEHVDARLALLVERLGNARDRTRAAEVLAEVAARHGARLAANADLLLAHAHDHDPRMRAAVLRFVGNAHLTQHIGWVIERLTADDEPEAAAAAATLRRLGTAATNALLATVTRGKRTTREAALRILRDVPVDFGVLRVLINTETRRAQQLALQRHGLRLGPVSDIVVQRLGERIAESVHTVLLLIAAQVHEDRIAALGHLLGRSPEGRGRAVLLEALEALLPSADRGAIMPLLEDGTSAASVSAAVRALGRQRISFADAVRETMVDQDHLTRALLTATVNPHTLARITGDRSAPHAPELAGAHDVRGLAAEAPLAHHGPEQDARQEFPVNKVEVMLHLRAVDLFARVRTQELSDLAALVREETYPAGGVIVREGEFGDCMYIVVDGEVRITREDKFVARITPGDFFGEMALFDSEQRFATVTAVTRVRLLRLERHELLQLIDDQPALAIAMCQTLARRVRDLINKIEGRGGPGE